MQTGTVKPQQMNTRRKRKKEVSSFHVSSFYRWIFFYYSIFFLFFFLYCVPRIMFSTHRIRSHQRRDRKRAFETIHTIIFFALQTGHLRFQARFKWRDRQAVRFMPWSYFVHCARVEYFFISFLSSFTLSYIW